MFFGSVVRLFDRSVCVTGMKGTGKDVMLGNVIARKRKTYVSNLDYGGKFVPLCLSDIDMGGNTYKDFCADTLKPMDYPYPKGADIYISDAGVYLPSQYCNELNKAFPALPTYVAFSRQISRNCVHFNVQNLNRVWDKFREQSDTYIRCCWCKVLFGKIVIQKITIYDKAESCQARVRPCRVRSPLICSGARRDQIDMYRDNFFNQHGEVRDAYLVYWNRSKHDTYEFEKKLGVKYTYEEKK